LKTTPDVRVFADIADRALHVARARRSYDVRDIDAAGCVIASLKALVQAVGVRERDSNYTACQYICSIPLRKLLTIISPSIRATFDRIRSSTLASVNIPIGEWASECTGTKSWSLLRRTST
jgi:hypothetical protein